LVHGIVADKNAIELVMAFRLGTVERQCPEWLAAPLAVALLLRAKCVSAPAMLALMHVLTRRQGDNRSPIARRWTLAGANEVWTAIDAVPGLQSLLDLSREDVKQVLQEVTDKQRALDKIFWYAVKWLTTPEPTSAERIIGCLNGTVGQHQAFVHQAFVHQA